MKKIVLSVAIHALAVGPLAAHAVSLNPKGLGQVLIYPYYTVNKSQDTYLSVANASDVGKVVRVRFHEGYNGRNVLDFTLYLSAHDTWAATVSAPDATTTSGARLSWSDNSCIDDLPQNPYPFAPYAYDGGSGMPPDSGPQTISRTREGHVEIIALGDIVPGSQLEAAITHVQPDPPTPNGGVPATMNGAAGRCPGVSALAEGALMAPSSGLFGSGAIVNVGEGTFYPYNADAITGFTDVPLFASTDQGRNVTLDDANSSEATNGVARAYLSDNDGKPLALDYAAGHGAVSAVFMTDALYNEYLVGAGLGANTDWVVTFPTKRFYTDQQIYAGNEISPFEAPFEKGQSNVVVIPQAYDREEGGFPPAASCPGGSPPECIPPTAQLAYEVNVIGFQASPGSESGYASDVLGSTLTSAYFPRLSDTGWAKLDLYASKHTLAGGTSSSGAGVALAGLPATGFMVYNIINSNAQPGKLANYSGLFPHRKTLFCQGNDPACP